jgi:hypothetical protein
MATSKRLTVGNALRRAVLSAARIRSNERRISGRIGDEAFRTLEAELDWSEQAACETSLVDGVLSAVPLVGKQMQPE